MDEYKIEMKGEATEAVKRFAALSPEKQKAALLIMHGIQIGEAMGASTAQSRPTA